MIRKSAKTQEILRENVCLYLAGRHAAYRDECLRQARSQPNVRDIYASSAREQHRLYMFYLRGLS
jgi:hypothetical protein